MEAVKVRENTKLEIEKTPQTAVAEIPAEIEIQTASDKSKKFKKYLIRAVFLLVAAVIALTFYWYYTRAAPVVLVKPKQAMITETITSSGRVGGETETNVSSQSPGIVQQVYVLEGAQVVRGQQLALIKNDVAEAQVMQAQAALNTAQTQLVQVSRGSLPSDIDAVMEQVWQAQAQVDQQNAEIVRSQKNVLQARALLAQFEEERNLAKKELDRSSSLVKDGVISRSEYDQSVTTFRVAEKKVTAQKQGIALAESGVISAQAGLKSAQANVRTQQARLRTIQSGARPEDILVAQQRVSEASKALGVAQQQAANANVIAPFAGTVTKINSEAGQTVGSTGILTLVSSQLEIRLNVDESNLSSLKVGQKAVVSSGTFADTTFDGTVTELGAAVDQTRGTIEIKVIPDQSPEWLRPGQTVDVNIIIAENISRLLVPQTALVRSGDDTVVFQITDGKVTQKIVETRPLTKEGVPVVSGLTADEFIITDASKVKLGDTVQAQ